MRCLDGGVKMTDEELKRAKEILKSKFYILNYVMRDRKKEWDELNVPQDLVKKWIKEHIDNELKSINLTEKDDVERNKLIRDNCLTISTTQHCVLDNELYEYLDKIVNIYKSFNTDEYLIYSEIAKDNWDRKIQLFQSIISENPEDSILDKSIFNVDNIFFGLLPLTYNLHRMDLFNILIDIVFDFIENAGYFNRKVIKATYDFIK